MTAKEFLAIELRQFVDDNPGVTVFYKDDLSTNTHVIEVTPSSFREDERFKGFEENLVFQFIDKFPFENVYFISVDSYVRMTNPEEVYKNTAHEIWEGEEFAFVIGHKAEVSEVYSIQNLIPDPDFAYLDNLEFIKAADDAYLQGFLASSLTVNSIDGIWADFVPPAHDFNATKIDNAEESNYAMAA